MNEPTRRAWSRPELIAIVRSTPEEAVLVGCKSAAAGPTAAVGNCAASIVAVCESACEVPVLSLPSYLLIPRPLALGNP